MLANTGELQAVKSNKLNICQAAFYQAGEVEVTDDLKISLESQGMVMLKIRGDYISQLTVADPSRKLTKALLTISGTYETQGDNFITYPNPDQNTTTLIVDLPQGVYAGKSVTIDL
ncbi:MAG: polysaccharide lyase beta-sandwich domain-containing protein [Bacteroidota bacterium]